MARNAHTHRPRRWAVLAALSGKFALVGVTTGEAARSPLPDTTGTTETTTGDSAEAGSYVDLEGAQQIVDQYSQPPADIPVTTPIEGEIPTGKTMFFIGCGTEYCSLEVDILQQAADILGWELVSFETDGTPESTTQAWTQAVNEGYDFIIYSATPRSQIGDLMDQAAENGSEIVGCCTVDEPDGVLDFVISTAESTGSLGEIMAAWVVTDAAEQGLVDPGVLYVDLPDFPILTALGENFESSISHYCPGCSYEKVDFGLADLEGAPDQIVSAVRASPDIKYVVFSTDSPFVGVPAALQAAGLDDVRLFGEGPTSAVLQNIESGDQAGSMAFAIYENFFTLVDACVRLELGLPLEAAEAPNMILTADNIEDTSSLSPLLPDTVDRFRALWGK